MPRGTLTLTMVLACALRDRGVQISQPFAVSALLAGLAMNDAIFRVRCVEAAEPMRLDRQRHAPFNQFRER